MLGNKIGSTVLSRLWIVLLLFATTLSIWGLYNAVLGLKRGVVDNVPGRVGHHPDTVARALHPSDFWASEGFWLYFAVIGVLGWLGYACLLWKLRSKRRRGS